MYYGEIPRLVPGPDGRYCITVERVPVSTPESAYAINDGQEQRWLRLVRQYDLCPSVAPPARSPSAQAAQFWRQIGENLLPRPAPRIAPGFMLAGKLGYLEVGGPLTATFDNPTPIGNLRVSATSQVYVDWGDGTGLQGPYDNPGAPWPHGTITHSWRDARLYDVRVVQRWVATWQLGGLGGELRDLSTEGRIEHFEVRQLQAVRNS